MQTYSQREEINMPTWQAGDIQANGITLHYTRTGGRKPPVVLLHGFSDDGLCWTPVTEQLEQQYDVIMVDARGHGRSDDPEEGYTPLDHAADVAGLITGLKLDRPAVLGHSMGAASAIVLAGLYPTLPRAVLLEDPPPMWLPPPPSSSEEANPMRDWIVNLKRKTREELIAHAAAESPTWAQAELGPWADAKLRLSFYVLRRYRGSFPDPSSITQGITCPVLLMTADPERHAIVTPELAAALQAMVPHTRAVNIPGAGHSIRREQFSRYMEVVTGFLAEAMA